MSTRLFVYGTLMQGERDLAVLEGYNPRNNVAGHRHHEQQPKCTSIIEVRKKAVSVPGSPTPFVARAEPDGQESRRDRIRVAFDQ